MIDIPQWPPLAGHTSETAMQAVSTMYATMWAIGTGLGQLKTCRLPRQQATCQQWLAILPLQLFLLSILGFEKWGAVEER